MKAVELVRLIERYSRRHGVHYQTESGKGSHLKLRLGERRTVISVHAGDMPHGTYRGILKQLGLMESDLKD